MALNLVDSQLVLLPEAVIEVLVRCEAPWGSLRLSADEHEQVALVTGYTSRHGENHSARPAAAVDGHYLRDSDLAGWSALWYRVPNQAKAAWEVLARQESAIVPEYLKNMVQGWRVPPVDRAALVVMLGPGDDPDVSAWLVHHDAAVPTSIAVLRESTDGTPDLAPGWPIRDVEALKVVVVGVGSIGSAVSQALAEYGVHDLALVDPDRLLPHNLVRHQAKRRWIGRYKVNAQRDTLLDRFPHLDVTALPLSVTSAADRMRSLFADADIVICCTDGTEARIVCSHLARWAGTPLVLACVLDDGAIGEIMRLRPGKRTGCLACQRLAMLERGEMDPEPGIDLGYGTGSRHRPMTAVGGDLSLVGYLAAKVAVATLLERAGHADQRLAGDHAIVSLRPTADAAAPFDLKLGADIRWLPAAAPVQGCPTCEMA
jgi:molybdopterin/thiamine biosynthesis adenylyltransferase